MTDLLTTIVDGLREDFGQPATLLRLLQTTPELRVDLPPPPLSIDATSIVRWHELGIPSPLEWPRRNPGVLRGWKASGNYYDSFTVARQEYTQLGQRTELKVELDINEVDGVSASKSDLTTFQTLDQLVETNSGEMIDEISDAKLAKNLAHREIRILHGDSDYFARYLWDGRTFLMNSGGSHHFAAARYLAKRLNQRVPLRGRLYVYELNGSAVAALRRDFEMFVISDEAAIANDFHEAMRSFQATWLWHPMPRPYEKTRAILLPRAEKRSLRVAQALRDAGVLDFGAYLTDLVAHQVAR